MPIYMKHPEHGTHIAYGDREVAECERHGWVVFIPEWEQPKVVPSPVADEVVEYAPPKRRGRPPKVKNDGDSPNAD